MAQLLRGTTGMRNQRRLLSWLAVLLLLWLRLLRGLRLQLWLL